MKTTATERYDVDDPASAARLAARFSRLDPETVGAALEERGHAVLERVLEAGECRALAALFEEPARFRKTVDLARMRFGAGGSYRYFAAPLPEAVRGLRAALYALLAPAAGAWSARLGEPGGFPPSLDEFLARCRAAGQRDPTPLLLDYRDGGYNCLHQDRYGEIAFPLQATAMLSCPGAEFTGGEFLLVEQRPRMQSRGEAVTLERGAVIVFPNAVRPVRGARGDYRVSVRHGVSRVRSGRRRTLGLIFHDAR